MKNKILVCTLSWDRVTYTKRLLETFLNNTDTAVDFLIVDNGSSKNTLEFLKIIDNRVTKNGSTIKVHYNSENLGVTKALNIGLTYKNQNQHFMKIDNDMIIPCDRKNWLNEMIEIIEFSKSIDNIKIIGLSPFNINRPDHYQRRNVELSNNKMYMIEDPGPLGILGCGQVIHKAVIDKIKNFEANINGKPTRYGHEDINFTRKAFEMGFRSVYHYQCKAIHGDYLDLPESQNHQHFKQAQLIRTEFEKKPVKFASLEENRLDVEFIN
jgi:glycosyltransferase involved in cell wall biosynthesis